MGATGKEVDGGDRRHDATTTVAAASQEPPLLQPWTHTEDHGPTADVTAAHIDFARGCAAVSVRAAVLKLRHR